MTKDSTNILFMGTPQFAATALHGLVEAGFRIVGVVTQPDTKSGRGGKISPSEIKVEATGANILVFQPSSKAELTEVVGRLAPELIVVAAYGMIVPQTVLDIPTYGALNIHGSLLPKYRGASPITEAILQGDKETGITIMQMSAGMDEGDLITSYKLSVSEDDTTASLTTKMAKLGAKAIVDTIPRWVSGEIKAAPQDNSKATYCKKLTKEDGHIDWNESAEIIERKVRAYTPWPTAYTFAGNQRIKLLKTSIQPGFLATVSNENGQLIFQNGHIYIPTESDTLEILELQPEGKNPMTAHDFINGNSQLDGARLR